MNMFKLKSSYAFRKNVTVPKPVEKAINLLDPYESFKGQILITKNFIEDGSLVIFINRDTNADIKQIEVMVYKYLLSIFDSIKTFPSIKSVYLVDMLNISMDFGSIGPYIEELYQYQEVKREDWRDKLFPVTFTKVNDLYNFYVSYDNAKESGGEAYECTDMYDSDYTRSVGNRNEAIAKFCTGAIVKYIELYRKVCNDANQSA